MFTSLLKKIPGVGRLFGRDKEEESEEDIGESRSRFSRFFGRDKEEKIVEAGGPVTTPSTPSSSNASISILSDIKFILFTGLNRIIGILTNSMRLSNETTPVLSSFINSISNF